MQRNTILFDGTDRKVTLVARGSMWPTAVEVDGERWERSTDVEEVSGRESMRTYVRVDELSKRRSG